MSREIDAAVAEHIMGWTNIRPVDDTMRDPETHEWWEDVWGDVPGADDNPQCVPTYSTWIQAAWQVVEKLCPTKNKAEPWFKIYTSDGRWFVNFHRRTLDESAATAPMAICIAALRSVGAEPPAVPTEGAP